MSKNINWLCRLVIYLLEYIKFLNWIWRNKEEWLSRTEIKKNYVTIIKLKIYTDRTKFCWEERTDKQKYD